MAGRADSHWIEPMPKNIPLPVKPDLETHASKQTAPGGKLSVMSVPLRDCLIIL
jgi:hypothetical protein